MCLYYTYSMMTDEEIQRWLSTELLPMTRNPPPPEARVSDLLNGLVASNEDEIATTKMILRLTVEWFKMRKKLPKDLDDEEISEQVLELWDGGWIIPSVDVVERDGQDVMSVEPLIWDGFDYAEPGKKYGQEHEAQGG